MDMMHFFLSGLEWVYDTVEDRFGRAAAWIVTAALSAAFIAAMIAIIKRIV